MEANRASIETAMSADGRYVVFETDATNLMEEEAYGYPHVHVHDRLTGVTELASITTDGYQLVGWAENPDISADGRYVAFHFNDKYDSMPYVAIYVHDRLSGITTGVSGYGSEDSSFGASLSGDGRYVAFSSNSTRLVPGDVNGMPDIFLRELEILSPITKTYLSTGAYDGWVLESGEDSEAGGRIDERANTFYLGDADNDQQYRSILHFETNSLPNNAVISKAVLKIQKQGVVGDNPFNTLGNILACRRRRIPSTG